jgi:hypothetical protein
MRYRKKVRGEKIGELGWKFNLNFWLFKHLKMLRLKLWMIK